MSAFNLSRVLAECQQKLDNEDYSCIHGIKLSRCSVCSRSRVNNIGRLDKLGCFKLDPEIEKRLVGVKEESFWDKIKGDFKEKHEKEAHLKTVKLLSELMQEMLEHIPQENAPQTFLEFLTQPM